MAWNIGANDVANAMGTSVGSGALTLKKAVIVAAVLEFSGAFLVGSHVTDTVRKGIVDPMMFKMNPEILMFGMLASLLAAAIWLQVATYFGLPVSTTHSIVGAIVGFALISGGVDAVNWSKLWTIVASWVVSPITGGVFSFGIFTIIKSKILNVEDPIHATKKLAPYLVSSVFFILTLVLLFKGLKQLHLDMSLTEALQIATIVAIISGVISSFFIKRFLNKRIRNDHHKLKQNEKTLLLKQQLNESQELLNHSENIADETVQWKIKRIQSDIEDCLEDISRRSSGKIDSDESETFSTIERVFIALQIISACFVAFAHGANDVANAIGPMAAVISIIKTNSVIMKVSVPLWVLGLGGVGIVVGLATWGWRVIETIGKKITELTPTRGFSAEFGAATTIVIASKLGMPISTTHTLVGSVLGVGMARGVASLNMVLIRNIFMSWFITLPAGAILSVIFFSIFKIIWG
ncbi:inorganic phosphate transporter [Candidatus Marinamargulisbacteria bacterium SCGC AAA071-K20]|nr:inorganic phosphate transporter [Candidatus Marinamargulisbacteria bacterium SCGC AAA071-K20]